MFPMQLSNEVISVESLVAMVFISLHVLQQLCPLQLYLVVVTCLAVC